MAAGSPRDAGPPDRTVRRAVVALAMGALVAFAVVVVTSTLVATHIARDEELAEAVRSGEVLASTVLVTSIQALVDGDPQALTDLDDAAQVRRRVGAMVATRVLTRDARVIYADDHSLIGKPLSPNPPAIPAAPHATLITVDQAESEIGRAATGRMVKVDMPVQLPDGTTVRMLLYSTDERLRTSESALVVRLIILSTGAVSLLLLLNLPVSVWLLRRVSKAHLERIRLLSNEIAAADRERRNIARDLHDGVVQDLAGAGYALEALAGTLPEGPHSVARQMLDLSHDAVRRSTRALRTLIVDVAPPDLSSEGLPAAIADLAARWKRDHGIDVDVTVDLRTPVSPQAATVMYRAVRECLTNTAAHSGAHHATITITSDPDDVHLIAEDDGCGFPPDTAERRRNGHIGLNLLAGAVADLGGRLHIDGPQGGGAVVRCTIPVA
ncbi:MAG: hypothetical protein J0I11_13850 [Actinobacteria bacterium]|nr:hypothetical protein [Actinomycetota bacterium]